MKHELRRMTDGSARLTVEFSMHDLVTVPLDEFDLAQLSEPSRGIADSLLDAELIARRIEQHERRKEAPE